MDWNSNVVLLVKMKLTALIDQLEIDFLKKYLEFFHNYNLTLGVDIKKKKRK